MTRYKYLIIIFALITGCKPSVKCDEGYGEFDQFFHSAITSIQEEAKKGNGLSGNSFRAVVVFDSLTNHSSKVNLGDVVTYDSYRDFIEDRKIWKEWISTNMCSISNDEFYKLQKSVIESTPWINESSPNE